LNMIAVILYTELKLMDLGDDLSLSGLITDALWLSRQTQMLLSP
jgi:hypothetical protein